MSLANRKPLKFIKDSVEFRTHQVDGIRWLSRRNNALIADDMGLGKSLEALTTAAVDFEKGWASRVLIVAPATLKGNWCEEMDEHTNFNYMVLEGTPKQRAKQLEAFVADATCHVLVTNYEQIKAHLVQLNSMDFDIVIYDEAHYIKGHRSQRTKACQALQAKRHLLLTGSPMLNHVNDLWSLLHRIDPIAWPKYWSFVNRYCVFGGFKDKQIVGVKNESELHERLEEVMLRRRKSDVLDLPDKLHIPVYVELLPEQRRLYKEIADDMMMTIPNNPTPVDIENALTRLLRLKQVCGTTASIEGYDDYSAKLDRVLDMIEEICVEQGEHVVVFTQFRAVLECLNQRIAAHAALQKAGVPFYTLHGDVPHKERVPAVKEWAADKPGVMGAMLQVAGVGLNMTVARQAIFLDKLWVPKLNEQAEDRLHRIGQSTTQPVQIYEIIARHTVDQRIETILRRKRKVFGAIVDTSDLKRKLIQAMMSEEEDD